MILYFSRKGHSVALPGNDMQTEYTYLDGVPFGFREMVTGWPGAPGKNWSNSFSRPFFSLVIFVISIEKGTPSFRRIFGVKTKKG